jgi:TonB-dependent receptor
LNDQYFTNPRQRVERTYDNLFFSTALKYDITDDLIFQLGMHQAIARPPLVQIAGPVSYNETETRVQSPNPGLLPEESNNYSARVAYYLPHSGVLSVGIFRIDIKNKWMSQYWVGENPNGDPPLAGEWNPADWGISDEYAGWTLQSTTNSRAEARFRGMEAEYRQTLGFLPGFLKSTFAYINYTRTYVEAREYFDTNGNRTRDMSVMGGVAPHQVNFGVDFKYKRLGFGLSGNWLDDTPWEFENSGARRMTRYREAAMKYHLNASFRLNQWATLALTGRNITNEPFVVNYRYYDGRPDVLYRSNIYGALWTLSLKGSF